LLVGVLVDRFSYFPAFALAATLPILATLAILFLIPREDDAMLAGTLS
jgi:hypothetical protein